MSLRRRLARLEQLQAQRVALTAEKKAAMDAVIAEKQLEIENLRAQVPGWVVVK